jgi:uncharacterized protein YbaR (Trm112 family)
VSDTSVNAELINILACPETKQALSQASAELLAQVNTRIETGSLRNRGGESVSNPLEAGLVREDGKVLYPVDNGIPVMLIEESIELD